MVLTETQKAERVERLRLARERAAELKREQIAERLPPPPVAEKVTEKPPPPPKITDVETKLALMEETLKQLELEKKLRRITKKIKTITEDSSDEDTPTSPSKAIPIPIKQKPAWNPADFYQ